MGKFIITEEEKNRIRGLYEQTQQITFKVIGIKMEREEKDPLVILRVQDAGSGEIYIDIQKYGKDLKTAYDTAIKDFEMEKSNKEIQYPSIKSVAAPTIDKLQAK